ncbi:MAG: ATPase domain-containing protein [Candidatus Pacearchaeota archaeon]
MKKEDIVEEKNKIKFTKLNNVSTGIPNLDTLLKGGFEEFSVNMIVGDSGSGKTIFATQFLVEGLKKGEKCLFITFEEKKEEFYKNMSKFGWDLESYEQKGNFFFLEYSPEKVKTMIEEGGGDIEVTVIKNKIKRMVIDSITSFALLFEGELEKREAALSLFDIIRKWKCTSLVTLQEDPLERKEGGSTSLEFEADSIILLYFMRVGDERKRLIEVLKKRGTAHSTKIYFCEIDEEGFKITSKTFTGGREELR